MSVSLKLMTFPVECPKDIPEHRKGKFAGCRRLWRARDERWELEGLGLTRREALEDMCPVSERF